MRNAPSRGHILQLGQRPAGNIRIHDPDVSHLDGSGPRSPIDRAADDQPAADTAADRDVKQGGEPLSRSIHRLGQARGVGVVLYGDAINLQVVAGPVRQRKLIPPLDLVRFRGDSPTRVNWPAESDPDSRDGARRQVLGAQQGFECLLDLRANPGRTSARVNLPALQREQLAIAFTESEL